MNGARRSIFGQGAGVRMKDGLPSTAQSRLAEAIALMRQALQLLDATQAPADIGAHLDLAIVRLDQCMSDGSRSRVDANTPAPEPKAASRSVG